MGLSPSSFSPGKISEEMLSQMFGEIKLFKQNEISAFNTQGTCKNKVSSPSVKHFIDQPKSAEIDSGFYQTLRVCSVSDAKELYVRGLGSNTINHLDNKGTLLNQIIIKSGNMSDINLSVTRDGRLVYSDCDDRSVNIVNCGKIDTMVRLQGWKPLALCCTSTNDLLVSMMSDDNKRSKVVRYTGSTITLEIQFDDRGISLFSYPQFIAENKNLDICVIDRKQDTLKIMDKVGDLKMECCEYHQMRKRRWYPQGLATDSQCHILVSDCRNNCVFILDHNTFFIRFIDNCNLYKPTDLSISSDDVLYIADHTKKVKSIKYLQ